MKKDKYPLGGGLMPSDPSRPGSASLGSRDMYSGMSGYMPNGYGGAYDSSMYSQAPYGAGSHMGSSPSSLYSRDYMSMYSPSSTTASSMSSYMNGYGSMYGSSSPYGSMAGPMSPEDGSGESGVVTHPGGHSPGSVKSEAGVGPATGSSGSAVSMGSGSPIGSGGAVPPPAGSGGPPTGQATVKREPMAPGSSGHPSAQGQDQLHSLMSMYLPSDTLAAANAGDPQAAARIHALYGQYGIGMSAPPPSHGGSDSMSLPPPPSAYPV